MAAPAASPSATFTCAIEPDRARVILRLAGEFDLLAEPEVEHAVAELVEVGFSQVVVDLRELTFMDSAGLRTLMQAERSVQASGGQLVLIRGTKAVDRLFELTGADGFFTFEARRAGR